MHNMHATFGTLLRVQPSVVISIPYMTSYVISTNKCHLKMLKICLVRQIKDRVLLLNKNVSYGFDEFISIICFPS